MYNKKMSLKENLIYGGAVYLMVITGLVGMLALYEFIENLFNLPV
jgi:hypothetical protein